MYSHVHSMVTLSVVGLLPYSFGVGMGERRREGDVSPRKTRA
jgi:hypothetical protein